MKVISSPHANREMIITISFEVVATKLRKNMRDRHFLQMASKIPYMYNFAVTYVPISYDRVVHECFLQVEPGSDAVMDKLGTIPTDTCSKCPI